ncbi:hypothetical protein J2S57_001898 [Kineosporia succinea]|uniref:Uncharacterized protein n=1 Tax=Kineosporia succinea TaxID=84632 RepID=A0ABT9P0F1_9ACTN|nr:hypothetical protein [Kineosporia succinea]
MGMDLAAEVCKEGRRFARAGGAPLRSGLLLDVIRFS